MKRIRVLIVDGVSTTRRMVSDLLGRDLELEVVGSMASGRLALDRLVDLSPDVVLLDVAQPDFEGLKTLAAIRETHPRLPVIMFSGLTERGSQATMDALFLGASDYVMKPASNAALKCCVQGELTAKIKSLGTAQHAVQPDKPPSSREAPTPKREGKAPVEHSNLPGATCGERGTESLSPRPGHVNTNRAGRGVGGERKSSVVPAPSPPAPLPRVRGRGEPAETWKPGDGHTLPKTSPVEASPSRPVTHTAEIVAIAASTGGPNALATLLSSLPPSFVTPIVIVQHMASGFTATLADSLCRQTGRNVREVETAQPLDAAAAWIAQGGRHLVVSRKGVAEMVAPSDDPTENGCRPSADVMFRSVADLFGSRCLAVVLTGMGHDGLAGCRAIRQAGGTILVQDEASSIAWGMPGQVATAGLADAVLPLSEVSLEICRRTTRSRDR